MTIRVSIRESICIWATAPSEPKAATKQIQKICATLSKYGKLSTKHFKSSPKTPI